MPTILLILIATLSAQTLSAQSCDIDGNVPARIQKSICKVATSVHGGGAPVNQLTVMFRKAPAYNIAAETPEAKNMMLTLLNVWKTDRKVRVARVEAYYGRARLAVAKTRAFGSPTVEFD